jgi:hypothetical protein
MPDAVLIDASGQRRSRSRCPVSGGARAPHNTGMRYPSDPPRVEEIIAVIGIVRRAYGRGI